jgi:hypothetical protein
MEAENSDLFHLEVPEDGGHCGFSNGGAESWAEIRAAEFLAAEAFRKPPER